MLQFAALFTLLACLLNLPDTAVAQDRFALLIGNQDYPATLGTLHNPHNDIRLIGDSLARIRFAVTPGKDLSRKALLDEVDKFALKLRNAGEGAIGFFYYAGHGASNPDNGGNYIIPAGTPKLADQSDWNDAVPLEEILLKLRRTAPNAIHFVVFDACRNELQLPVRGGERGYESMPAKRGMVLAFSTEAKSTASDSGDGGGPYARALATQLLVPGLNEYELFQRTASSVFQTTKKQWPYAQNGLLKPIILNAMGEKTATPTPPEPKKQETQIVKIAAPEAPSPTLSQWHHNGSIMRLESEKAERKFYYLKPRAGITAEGVRPGTLLFTGTRIKDEYQGIAYIFDRRCGSVPYKVSGNVSADQKTVEMTGRAPNQFDSQCRVVAYRDDRLRFSFLE